jgi:hypothetical protein
MKIKSKGILGKVLLAAVGIVGVSAPFQAAQAATCYCSMTLNGDSSGRTVTMNNSSVTDCGSLNGTTIEGDGKTVALKDCRSTEKLEKK